MISNRDFLLIGGAAILIFIVLTLFIIFFVVVFQRNRKFNIQEKEQLQLSFQKELLKTQLETQENTFHQIGEELHDNIGQLLSSTRMLLGITERSLTEVPDTLRTADQTLAKAIQDLRMLSKSLNHEWLHQFNVLDNLEAEVLRINAARTVDIQLNTSVNTLPLNPESQVMLFRIIQEALHNSIKHAEATIISISISLADDIKVLIKDDGKGFNVNETGPTGIGLLNMTHRTSLLGGSISWSSLPGQGTEVSILLPVTNNNI